MSAGMRYLYLIRHGDVECADGKKRCIGRTDVPLSEAGKARAKELSAYFREHPVEAVYSSPLKRARETARILSGGKIPCYERAGLSELDMGEWENLPLAEIKKELESEPASGERRADGVMRFSACIRGIMAVHPGDVAVVAHAGINCCYLSQFLDISLERSRSLAQPYCGISRLSWEGDGRISVLELGRRAPDSPDREACGRIWEHYHTPLPVREHMEAVERTAMELADRLEEKGVCVRRDILSAAALLHDVVRQREDHPLEGAKALIREGYPLLAPLILCHHDWERRFSKKDIPGGMIPAFEFPLEAELLYLADKYRSGAERVSIEERFRRSAQRFRDDEEARKSCERRYQEAKKIEEHIGGRWK